jgi:hypothetical protein
LASPKEHAAAAPPPISQANGQRGHEGPEWAGHALEERS